MPKIEQSIRIDAPIETVFAAIAAVEHYPRWISAVREIRDYSGTPAVGATFVEIATFMGKILETGKIITVHDPPYRITHGTTYAPFPRELTFTLAEGAEGTTLTYSFQAEPNGFFGSLPLNILVVAMEVLIKGSLSRLKKMIEEGWFAEG